MKNRGKAQLFAELQKLKTVEIFLGMQIGCAWHKDRKAILSQPSP